MFLGAARVHRSFGAGRTVNIATEAELNHAVEKALSKLGLENPRVVTKVPFIEVHEKLDGFGSGRLRPRQDRDGQDRLSLVPFVSRSSGLHKE